MLKKTFAAVATTAVLLGSSVAMAQPNLDPNWAFSKELIEVLKNKNGYTVIKKIEAENPANGIWKAEGVKGADQYEIIFDSTGKVISEKKD
ncbi:PepSY domain-containing protein [Pseudomonas sp. 7P_10.2_Bac1]|uniref:PepSY domain-containing protein n=1 Tax=Pseudomonas sp. 7P_10.2_Bac1 TaxID=2971614 RepID=UPI0021C70CB5|nr:PepSY domain-containing protein [Pseudomonas sp. 7P_10.2_Bac1]MCU1726756.1 PepSY domain-containing protein [Pseudomonas sp. 7P_10.2_Bac1]